MAAAPQHLAGIPQLIVLQQMGTLQAGNGPAGGVELHRQRHQLEQRGEGKQHDADEEQRPVVQHQPHQQQDEGQAGTDPRGRDDGRAQPHRPVVFRVLDSVARLVGRHAHRRDGGGVVDCLRQVDGIVPGVVVVCQISPAGPDRHTEYPVSPQHRFRRLGTGDAAPVVHGIVPPEAAGHLELGPQGQQQHWDQQQDVQIICKKVAIAVIDMTVIGHKNLPGSRPAGDEMDCNNSDRRQWRM